MRNVLFALLSLLVFSCNQDTASKEKELSGNPKNISFTDNMEILGNWIMCSSFESGMMTQFNVCPTILFLANGFGFVGSSSQVTDHFSWKFEKGKLNIFTNDKTSNAIFTDTFYFARITMEKKVRNLVISAERNDSRFYLSR